MLEETGIDIKNAEVLPLNTASGEHEKTLRDTGERVFVKMYFYNYRINLSENASDVVIKTEDDWYEPFWFELNSLKELNLSEPIYNTSVAVGLI